MNPLRLSACALAFAGLSLSSAQAGLIVGWSAFGTETGSDIEPPQVNPNFQGNEGLLTGYISLLTDTNTAATLGSSDDTWGSLSDPFNTPGTNNGFVRIRDSARIDLYLVNSTDDPMWVNLSDIYFDYSKQGAAAPNGLLSLWWEIGTPTQLLSASVPTSGDTTVYNADYEADDPANQTFFIAPGADKLVLSFRSDNRAFRLDNIRVDGSFSAIPEVSSSLVFGGLLAAGILVRRRPRALPAL